MSFTNLKPDFHNETKNFTLTKVTLDRVVLRQGAQERFGRSIVAKGLAEVSKAVNVPWTEDKAAAELKRISTQLALAMPSGFGALSRLGVITAKKV